MHCADRADLLGQTFPKAADTGHGSWLGLACGSPAACQFQRTFRLLDKGLGIHGMGE